MEKECVLCWKYGVDFFSYIGQREIILKFYIDLSEIFLFISKDIIYCSVGVSYVFQDLFFVLTGIGKLP